MALQKCLMQHQLLSPRCGAHSSFAQSASPRPVLRPRCATGYRVYQNPSNSCSSPAALPPPLLRRHLQHQRWCGHTIAASAQGSGGSGSRGTPPAPDIAQGIDAAGACSIHSPPSCRWSLCLPRLSSEEQHMLLCGYHPVGTDFAACVKHDTFRPEWFISSRYVERRGVLRCVSQCTAPDADVVAACVWRHV